MLDLDCYCEYKGQRYETGTIIYHTTDGDGTCITATCRENGTIVRNMELCPVSTTPTPTPTTHVTIFNFTSTSKYNVQMENAFFAELIVTNDPHNQPICNQVDLTDD